MQKPLREVALVVSLEHVLVRDEPENGDGFVQDDLDLGVRFLRPR
jgi:hypothetical protein